MSNPSLRFSRVPALRPGSHVRLVAPCGPFDREAFERGVAKLRKSWVVTYDESIFESEGFLAGSDARRLAELNAALTDQGVDAIIAARGGYGSMRLLPDLDPQLIARANKLLVGFSDMTALHAAWQRAGLRSIHGSMVASLGNAPDERLERWINALSGHAPYSGHSPRWVTRGRVVAPVVGGNLAVLCALLGTPYFPPVDDAILFIEDVGEAPYRVDRMLTTLTLAGVFERAAGVLVGEFTKANAEGDGRNVNDVLRERLGRIDRPVYCGVPAGHVEDNWEIPLGGVAELDADRGSITFLEGAVQGG